MTDLELAKAQLPGHSICIVRGDMCLTDDGKGISPMLRLLAAGTDLTGASVADVIVGKAAAMLFVCAGIARVHGNTMSEGGKAYLEAHQIACSYDQLTERIINRSGTDLCPMEKAVAEIEDAAEGYAALRETAARMSAKNHNNS